MEMYDFNGAMGKSHIFPWLPPLFILVEYTKY